MRRHQGKHRFAVERRRNFWGGAVRAWGTREIAARLVNPTSEVQIAAQGWGCASSECSGAGPIKPIFLRRTLFSGLVLVTANGRMTIEFQVDETGAVTGVVEHGHRHRRTIPRSSVPPADRPASR
jgi:hypothetical protein